MTTVDRIIYQAKADGTIELAAQSEKLSDEKLKEIFEESLAKRSWQIRLVSQETGLLIYNVNVGSIAMGLYVYLSNVRSSSRGRTREQRIQLNSSISTTGFGYVNARSNKCLILGIYHRENEIIISAWNAEKKNNNGKQKSCYIDIETIAMAMRDGFYRKSDTAGDIVCAFRPEFIHYYLMNLANLHK